MNDDTAFLLETNFDNDKTDMTHLNTQRTRRREEAASQVSQLSQRETPQKPRIRPVEHPSVQSFKMMLGDDGEVKDGVIENEDSGYVYDFQKEEEPEDEASSLEKSEIEYEKPVVQNIDTQTVSSNETDDECEYDQVNFVEVKDDDEE